MGHLRPAPEKENPESVAAESGVQGIEALPKRVSRYGQAKTDALDVAKYMRESGNHQAMAEKVASCGDYLTFRNYFTVDQVRLHQASSAKSTCFALSARSEGALRPSKAT